MLEEPFRGASGASTPRDATNWEMERWTNVTAHESTRIKKAAERSQQLIKSRIRYLAREEEKQWRTLEDVRRRAVIIEDGRQRYVEKKVAHRQIQTAKEREFVLKQENVSAAIVQERARVQRLKEVRQKGLDEKRLLTRQKRAWSEDIIRARREEAENEVVQKMERASMIQRDRVTSWLQICREKADCIARLRSEKEEQRLVAAREAMLEEEKLQDLEGEEMKWIERLKNSRTATQSALAELEHTFGTSSSLQTALKLKKQGSVLDQAKLLNGETPPMIKNGEITPSWNKNPLVADLTTSPRSARTHANHSRDLDPFAPPKRRPSGLQSPRQSNGIGSTPRQSPHGEKVPSEVDHVNSARDLP